MSRKPHPNLTPAELELMKILWELGPASVQMVADQLPAGRDLAYTTVQSVLNTLHRKGKVKRTLQNRTYLYRPAVSHARAAAAAIQDLVSNLFGGSPELMVLSMLEARQLTPEKLRDLENLVAEAQKRPPEAK